MAQPVTAGRLFEAEQDVARLRADTLGRFGMVSSVYEVLERAYRARCVGLTSCSNLMLALYQAGTKMEPDNGVIGMRSSKQCSARS
jgi:hypothetical protein